MRCRWQLAIGASLTIVMLSAVAVVGLTLLGSDVLSSWKPLENAEQVLASGNAFEGLLTLEAPTSTVARLEATTKEAQYGNDAASNVPLLVKNWKFTQRSLEADAWQLSWELYFAASQVFFTEELLDKLGSRVNQPQVDRLFTSVYQLLVNWQAEINSLIFPPFRPPAIPPASPSL